MINCEGCSLPIREDDRVLIIQWNDELPEMIIHKSFSCLLMLEEINEGIGSFEMEDEKVGYDERLQNLILRVLYDNQNNPMTSGEIRDEVNKRLREESK